MAGTWLRGLGLVTYHSSSLMELCHQPHSETGNWVGWVEGTSPRRKQTGLQRGAQTLVVAPWVVRFAWADSGLENCSVPLTQVEVVVFPLLFSAVLQFAC